MAGHPALSAGQPAGIMRREDLIAFAQRDWPAIEESKAAYWLERERRLGRGEVFRAAEDLRRFAAAVRPG